MIKHREFPPYSIPIQCDIQNFNFQSLTVDGEFNVILMDPPWKFNISGRGVSVLLSFNY